MHVLFVGTGNVCRSPLAERLVSLYARQIRSTSLTAASAGLDAHAGDPIDACTSAVLAGMGGTATGFVAREFDPGMADEADLVLTLDRDHRSAVLRLAPRSLRKTFTLREAAAVHRLVPAGELPTATDLHDRGLELVAALARRRNDWRTSTGATDIPDPYRRSVAEHAEVGDRVLGSLAPLLLEMSGHRPAAG